MTGLFDSAEAEYTGVLTRNAEVRSRVLDGGAGLTVPVLCIDMEIDSGFRPLMHIERLGQPGAFTQAEAQAKQYRKGDRITVRAPLVGMRVSAPNATHITKHDQQEG